MPRQETIHHCFDLANASGGGIETYVETLLKFHPSGVSDRLLSSLTDIDQSQYELLHVHQQKLLWELRGECPTVYTVHNHGPYCPSGTKFLRTSGCGCDRQVSTFGCIWGHLIDGCGSRKPQNILQGFQNAHQDIATLKQLNVMTVAISDYVRNQLIRHGLPAQQVVTVRNSILMPETLAEPLTREIHQQRRILFVGRVVPYKGLEWLLKTLPHTDPRIHLDIAGDGWDRPRMERFVKTSGLSDRVTWHGWCNSRKVEELYQQCFTLVFPSLWHEPAGLVSLEAYAHHRPVIASHMGGIPEYVQHEKTGILVPSNDVKALASAIDNLAENYSKAKQIGEQGHAYLLQELTLNQHIQQLKRVYEVAIQNFYTQKTYNLS